MTGKAVAKKDEPATEVAENESAVAEPVAQVTEHPGGWHVVTFGGWQVSVGPDGLLMLPRHLDADETDDFVSAIVAAATLGANIKRANEQAALGDDLSRAPRAAATAGGVPAGAVRMPFTKGNAPTERFTPARRIQQYGPQPAGTQGQQRPRVPLPPPGRRREQ